MKPHPRKIRYVPLSLRYALTRLTRADILFPEDHVTNVVRRCSLYWHPMIGIGIGIVAALPPVLATHWLGAMQGLVLLTLVIYLFLLEWLGGFRAFRDFCTVCDTLAGQDTPENRLSRMTETEAPGAVAVACASLLTGAKILAAYLLFLRLALFEKTMLLAFALVMTPFLARITALVSATMRFSPGAVSGMAQRGPLVLGISLLIVLYTEFFAFAHGFGEFIYLTSWEVTAENFRRIELILSERPEFFEFLLGKGLRDTAILLAGAYLTWLYWNGEVKRKLGGIMAEPVMGAVTETAELAFLGAFLLIADYMLF